MTFGILSFGHALGDAVEVDEVVGEYTDDASRVHGWGFQRFRRAKDGVGLTDLAVEAATVALQNAGVAGAEVDLVVLAMSDIAEYLYWDPAAAVQGRLGARNAEAVLLTQACGGGVAGFDIVAGKFATHPDYRTALIIGANRVADAYWNRMEINTSIFSDGASAVVVRRGHDRLRWLATEIITDGRYADFMRMPAGGAAEPFGTGTGLTHVRGPQDRLEEFFEGDVRRMFEFVSAIRKGNRTVVERACARAGVELAQVERIVHFHDSLKALTELAKDLGLPVERTNARIAMEYGHLGCADQMFGLDQHLLAGELRPGDVAALTSNASGMHWLCTVVRV